jgi:crotonobetainyl-CoA:carnitine CoA-transferase CaiB-like acyl-CoA transferase
MATAWRARQRGSTSALGGIRLLDASGVGAFAAMLFADFGADVIRVSPAAGARPGLTTGSRLDLEGTLDPHRAAAFNALHRGQRSIALDLKASDGRRVFEALAGDADVILESFRPGVMKRLGIGYDALAASNPRLVYCSISGYGQTGPYRQLPGHDINYIALGGLLGLTRREGTPPAIPINFGADFAGGGLYAALAILIALRARDVCGRGQYIDMAMSDGVLSLLTAAFIGYFADGEEVRPGAYFLNGGAPWYDVYECADGSWLALGCIEPRFFGSLCEVLDLAELAPRQFDPGAYPEMRARLTQRLAEKPRDDWMRVFQDHEIAASPVLEMREIQNHAQFRSRGMIGALQTRFGPVCHIGVAPKLSLTPGQPLGEPPEPGRDTVSILRALGFAEQVIERMLALGIAAEPAETDSTKETHS